MKGKSLRFTISLILVLAGSCNEPETVVTNYVHPDGSVTRKIEMRSIDGDINKRFQVADFQVPFDSTWQVKDSLEVSAKGDTIWVRRAEKLFRNVEEINLTYSSDSGVNRKTSRKAIFSKRFKWFNTVYRYSENVGKSLTSGYPVKDFLNDEELLYFYSPEVLKQSNQNGPDSLKFRTLADSVRKKSDQWAMKNIVSEWIDEFSFLTSEKGGIGLSKESLKSKEDRIAEIFNSNQDKFDSLWANGHLLKEFIGEENALKYKTEADTAIEHVFDRIFIDFKDYSVSTIMPGEMIGTNGFIDTSKTLTWPVKSDYFLTTDYEMWAESKVSNTWAWVISVVFLLFVLTGVVFRIIKKD